MSEFVLITGFIVLWGLIVYHHLLFPLLLKLLGRRNNQQSALAHLPVKALPTITLVIPAYNEADTIEAKIQNIAQLAYPTDRLTLIIACDGCTDDTATRAVKALRAPDAMHLNARLWCFSANAGKTELLNRVLSRISTDIVALSDASALISVDALQRAAVHFQHPRTGVVAGSYCPSEDAHTGERLYWHYQRLIRQGEARLGAPIGVHGALWFMRTRGFRPLAADTINDDFILPMQMIERGYQAVYDPTIQAIETESINLQGDLSRRQRIGAGNLQQLLRLRALLHPRFGGIAFAFFSGKALRGLMPFILPAQLGLNALLALSGGGWLVLLVAQLLLIALALTSLTALRRALPAVLNGPCYLISGYIAGFIGCIQYMRGTYRRPWQRVAGRYKTSNAVSDTK